MSKHRRLNRNHHPAFYLSAINRSTHTFRRCKVEDTLIQLSPPKLASRPARNIQLINPPSNSNYPATRFDNCQCIHPLCCQPCITLYTIDQGSPCPLATLNPFGRELLLSDISTGFKRSTWIERSIMYMIMYMIMNMTSYDHEYEHVYKHDLEDYIEAKPLIFKVRSVL
jgi:hypothetical protein